MANETPKAALDEFVRAVRTPVDEGRADPNVAAAFAAGWHAADARASAAAWKSTRTDDDAKRELELARSMLKADVARLKEPLAAAEQPVDEVAGPDRQAGNADPGGSRRPRRSTASSARSSWPPTSGSARRS